MDQKYHHPMIGAAYHGMELMAQIYDHIEKHNRNLLLSV
jgi:hypothetical protein